MKEVEFLRQKGILITEKQYKIIIIKVVLLLIISSAISIGGSVLMVLASKEKLIIAGLVIFIVGALLLIFDVFYIMNKYAAKIQLYRHYKKYPEDFETEIDAS